MLLVVFGMQANIVKVLMITGVHWEGYLDQTKLHINVKIALLKVEVEHRTWQWLLMATFAKIGSSYRRLFQIQGVICRSSFL